MKIKNHRSTTAGVVPNDATSNTEGVFSVNIADTPPSVWVGDGTGVRKIGSVVSGTEPTDPTEGSIWANSNTNDVFMYVNGEWLRLNGGGGIFTPEEQIATAGQTVFNLSLITYQVNTGRMSVYRNGVRLRPTDFNETSNTQVTLVEPASLGDEMLFLSGEEVSDTEEYVLKTGDTMTGDLTVPNLTATGAFTSKGIDDNAAANALTIDSSGHAIIPAGVTLGTAAGVYNPANTLDDYEEGSWTPTVTPDLSGSISLVVGSFATYTKIGNRVIIDMSLTVSSVSSPTGDSVSISLPFTVLQRGSAAVTFYKGSAATATVEANTFINGLDVLRVYVDAADVAASTTFRIGGEYPV